MTNRQVLEVKMNLLEFLLLTCKEQPEELYNYTSRTLQHMKEQWVKEEPYGQQEYHLTSY